MPTEIKAKFSAKQTLTMTLASLASSTSKVGRQSAMVDNSTNRYRAIHLFIKVMTGTTPTTGKGIYVHGLKGNDVSASTYRTDGAGSGDAALTVVNAPMIGGVATDGTSNKAYYIEAVIHNPGPEWGIAIHHDTVAALNATGSNHEVTWVGETDESQ